MLDVDGKSSESSQRILIWTGFGGLFAAAFFSALIFLGAFQSTKRQDDPSTKRQDDPADVERRAVDLERKAVNSLKDLASRYERDEVNFPRKPAVVPLSDDCYGKHKFEVEDSTWNVEPNKESVAYPFKGSIRVRFTRWATSHHKTEALAKADEKFFLATYDDVRSFYADAAFVQKALRLPQTRTMVYTFLFDKVSKDWIKQAEAIK